MIGFPNAQDEVVKKALDSFFGLCATAFPRFSDECLCRILTPDDHHFGCEHPSLEKVHSEARAIWHVSAPAAESGVGEIIYLHNELVSVEECFLPSQCKHEIALRVLTIREWSEYGSSFVDVVEDCGEVVAISRYLARVAFQLSNHCAEEIAEMGGLMVGSLASGQGVL